MEGLKGLATGIGSLPHQDAEKALDLIFKYVPAVPFWPQLPKRSPCEGMISQFSENLPCLKVDSRGLIFDSKVREKELEVFYDKVISRDLSYFGISELHAQGFYKFLERLSLYTDSESLAFIKLHITGPFTFAAGIKDENNISLLHDKILMQAFLQGLKMKALWQIDMLRRFSRKIILFLDEPYLSCFGSAYTSLNKEDVVSGLSEFAEGLKSEGILLGLHCCGNTDWSMIMDSKAIDILSFDAFDYLDKLSLYAEDLKSFLGRGGVLSWGIIPTQSFDLKTNVEFLVGKIQSGIRNLSNKGLDTKLLHERIIVTPACGLGTFSDQKAEEIFKALFEVSSFIRENL